MKYGKSLSELAAEVERQQNQKRDFIADTRTLEIDSGNNKLLVRNNGEGGETFNVSTHAHKQIASRLQIPQQYYDRMMAEVPELLDENVNTWFRQKPEQRMVRTLDGNMRAFLSNRYRRRDNYDLMQAILPTLPDGLEFKSCDITEQKLYLKFGYPKLRADVVGDVVESGAVIGNSEIGAGSTYVYPFITTLSCTNGMTATKYGLRKHHVGRNVEIEAGEATELFSNETLALDDAAFFAKVTDTIRAVIDEKMFQGIVNALNDSSQVMLGDPIKAVELLQNKNILTNETEKTGVLQHLINGGKLNAYGLANAVTRFSQDVSDYDRASELEQAGWEIVEAPYSWQEVK